MQELTKYQAKNYYPEIKSIRDIVVQKYPSLNKIISNTSRADTKQIVVYAVSQYVDDTLLPLSPVHLKMIVEWITSEYDPRTQLGGALGYTIEDIHLVFRMGLRGDFGKPIGHKYILTDITAEGGWFDQYHAIRGRDHAEYHEQRNRSLEDKELPTSKNPITCPEEYRTDITKIGRSKKMAAVYNSPKLKMISEKEIKDIVENVLKANK